MALLSVRDLTVRYESNLALDGVSFDVAAGQVVAIIGPNGAGKTTCFNAINGQCRPNSGRVLLDGQDIAGRRPEELFRLGVGRTFQITATVASMTVRENVQMALISRHRRTRALWPAARGLYLDEANALLASVEMAEQAERPCSVLAYGDLKRLELVVALANRPKLLVMDEPTAGMAPAERSKLMTLAWTLAKQRNLGILFTEHDIDIVFFRADHIIVLNRGQLIAAGSPAAIRDDSRVREVYLGGGAVTAETVVATSR